MNDGRPRLFVFGWDGADWAVIHAAWAQGRLSTLRRLADAYFPLVPYYNLRPRDPNVPSAAEWLTAQRRRDGD